MTVIGTPSHFPEGGFEPSGLLEDHDQLCLPGGRDVEIGKSLQVRLALAANVILARNISSCCGSLDH